MKREDERPFFEVIRERCFSASHQLRGYQGKCERLHGHNWKVRVAVRASTLDAQGMVIDFHVLDDLLGRAVQDFEGRLLNETPPFSTENPSAEGIALLVAERVKKALPRPDAVVDRVEVWENDRSSAIYYPAAS